MQKIATAFVKAKKEFSPALKDKTNPAFRSKYADLGACLEAVNDALLNNGIALVQRTSEDSTGVTVETVFLHESGETMESGKLHVPAAKQDPQGYGSALTYARRYSLMTACGIAPEDDDGNSATDAKRREAAKPPTSAVDMSPKARAARITAGVQAGDASGAAVVLANETEKVRDAIWAFLDAKTQDELTSVWPEVAA
ncbi:hypothetical protein ABIC89_001020 [Variovorax boronicumulans]|uniref:ERF family protein n=1 Tax=Variovorax boronicumulans TaxID=436515 RepID=UPI003391E58C